jgi:hypothetical protein
MRTEDSTEAKIHTVIFWVMTPYSDFQRFRVPRFDAPRKHLYSVVYNKNISSESKETLLWFVILIPFYLTNTVT